VVEHHVQDVTVAVAVGAGAAATTTDATIITINTDEQ
jgi:hypothetical protein